MVNVTIEDLTTLAAAIADGDIIEMERPGAPSITRKVTKINFVTDIDNADIAAGAGIATSKLADAANFVLIDQSNAYDANNQDFRSGNLRLANPLNTFHYAFVAAAIVADRMINLPLLAATDTLAVLALAQNFITGRKDFFDSILGIRNPADTFSYIFRSSAIIANRNITLPLLTGNIILGDSLTSLIIPVSDEDSILSAGATKVTFRMPFGFTLTEVRASLTTAGTGAALVTVNINESGSTILSTKITIDANEKTSETAATPPVISDSVLADDAEMTIDIDTVDTDNVATGLKVYLIGRKTP